MSFRKKVKPSLTILVFAYNHENYIKDCILSILNQKTSYKLDVIIFDDHSNDKTSKILKLLIKKQPNIKLIISKKNYGSGRECMLNNYGNKITTDYYAFLDGDDYYLDDNKIQLQLDFLENHKNLVGCGHFSNTVNENGKKIGVIETKNDTVSFKNWFDTKNGPIYMHTSSFIWRNINGKIYDKKIFLLKAYGDTLYYFNKLNSGPVGVIPKHMSCYRIHDKGIWGRKSTKEKKILSKKLNIKVFFVGFPKTMFIFFYSSLIFKLINKIIPFKKILSKYK